MLKIKAILIIGLLYLGNNCLSAQVGVNFDVCDKHVQVIRSDGSILDITNPSSYFLSIGHWGEDVLETCKGLDGFHATNYSPLNTPGNTFIDKDADRFKIRVYDIDVYNDDNINFVTIDIATYATVDYATTGDDVKDDTPTPIQCDKVTTANYFESEWMLLVSPDYDEDNVSSTFGLLPVINDDDFVVGSIGDNSPNDRTHQATVGSFVNIKYDNMVVQPPVYKKDDRKVVRIVSHIFYFDADPTDNIITTLMFGEENTNADKSKAAIELQREYIEMTYACIGIKPVGQSVEMHNLSTDLGLLYYFNGCLFLDEMEGIIKTIPTSTMNINVFYVPIKNCNVNQEYAGLAFPRIMKYGANENYPGTFSVFEETASHTFINSDFWRYPGNDTEGYRRSVLAHEVGHIFTNLEDEDPPLDQSPPPSEHYRQHILFPTSYNSGGCINETEDYLISTGRRFRKDQEEKFRVINVNYPATSLPGNVVLQPWPW